MRPLRPPLQSRLQGHRPYLARRALGPEKADGLYKRAGAKYFVALANHHDNFDCYDSKYQPWNSVKIGPKKDIVGTWEKAAQDAGLRFGVTVHAARAWSWFEPAQGADKKGPLAGVPYDGKLTKANGKGTWWEGLDPQDLYAQNHAPGQKPDAAYCTKFYNRTIDLINKYKPDLLYFDDDYTNTGLPLYDADPTVGLRIAAHYYNTNRKQHDGKLEAVLNAKKVSDKQGCVVLDIERGAPATSSRSRGRRTPASATGTTGGQSPSATATRNLAPCCACWPTS